MLDYKNKNITVGLINLRLNNTFSIINSLNRLGYKVKVIDKQSKIKTDILILPGVGAFPKAMKYLKATELDKRILEFSEKKYPVVGICLGMQLLFEKSEEFRVTSGLGLLQGCVKKIPLNKSKIPNIGWQQIKIKKNNRLINNKLFNKYFYFIHSYYCKPKIRNEILATTKINNFEFCSSVNKNNIYGMQFHPEKSSTDGYEIFKNLRKIV